MDHFRSQVVLCCHRNALPLCYLFASRTDDRLWLPVFNDISTFETNVIYVIYTNYEKPVETFFVIAGLLVTWSMMGALDRNTLNIPRMYLHRYLRYTPTLAVMILFFISFPKFLGSGPFFNPPTDQCEQYWWTALLHVSVYTNPQAMVAIAVTNFIQIFIWEQCSSVTRCLGIWRWIFSCS